MDKFTKWFGEMSDPTKAKATLESIAKIGAAIFQASVDQVAADLGHEECLKFEQRCSRLAGSVANTMDDRRKENDWRNAQFNLNPNTGNSAGGRLSRDYNR